MHPDHIPDGFGPLLGYCDHQACRLMVRRLRRFDVSPMQCRTLTYLHRQTGDVTQKMLQQHLMVRPLHGQRHRRPARGEGARHPQHRQDRRPLPDPAPDGKGQTLQRRFHHHRPRGKRGN